jgi:hypothetical protein
MSYGAFGRVATERAMGGMGGEIRGKTKVTVYKKFRAQVNRKKQED